MVHLSPSVLHKITEEVYSFYPGLLKLTCLLRAFISVETAALTFRTNNTALVTAVISFTANDSVTISF